MDNSNLRLILLMLLFIFGGALYSVIIAFFTKSKILRFLPSIAGVFIIPYLIYRMYYGNLEGFMPLAYLIFIFMITAVILGNVLAGVIISYRNRSKKR
ncbi:hypothetical protein [Proteiniclasticum sp.]|uniref:hypothetical protein n=1 Tax=Proteiniclasticum sp. TaxID=2053595 RepID=UPI00289B301C|nr:hypothetical protein [Proteiniclasticum sp.]